MDSTTASDTSSQISVSRGLSVSASLISFWIRSKSKLSAVTAERSRRRSFSTEAGPVLDGTTRAAGIFCSATKRLRESRRRSRTVRRVRRSTQSASPVLLSWLRMSALQGMLLLLQMELNEARKVSSSLQIALSSMGAFSAWSISSREIVV